jgi:dTDP-4-dehydrorhamnose reductase
MIDSKSRVLILGKNGMLGRDLQTVFHDRDFVALSREELDLNDEEAVMKKFTDLTPDLVINATGFTNVEKAEDGEEETANKINGYAVGVLAKVCREVGATLVHFSSDYVFDGTNKNGYTEEAATKPINAYGRSKLLGEMLLMDEMEMEDPNLELPEGKYYLIRTSWLFGRHGINFIEKILAKAVDKQPWKVIDDQIGCPTSSLDLAKQVKWLVESNEYDYGIYHITNSGHGTWYDLAKDVLAKGGLEDLIKPCKTEEFPLKAKRPKYSILKNTKLPEMRHWKEAVEDYLAGN